MNKLLLGLTICIFLTGISTTPATANGSNTKDQWSGHVLPLEPVGGRLLAQLRDPTDPQLQQELYQFLYLALAQSTVGALYGNADYPDFWPFLNQAFNMWGPNPDTAYALTPIDDQGIYRLSGFRGSVRIADVQVGNGPLVADGSSDAKGLGKTLSNFDLDKDVTPNMDGAFEVILSKQRPEEYQGDWWQLKEGANYIVIRQVAYDWINEVDGRFAIERLDLPAMKPRESAEEIAAKLAKIPKWTENWAGIGIAWINNLREQGLINKLRVDDLSKDSGGYASQIYVQGLYDIADDEALILETTVPECRYWSFQLTDELWRSHGWMYRQTNINGHQAVLDSDGKFRAVISIQDPSVPNWLDTGGLNNGYIEGRWESCEDHPLPTIKKVKLSEVRRYLPEETAVVAVEQREYAIRLRSKGAQFRRRW
jgi:hypothetical protein